MKYPNTKFSGMNQVTSMEIKRTVSEYHPKNQEFGAKRLALLNKVTNLDELIDFCIDGYRAWGDAVLMGAGAYLKIGDYPAEIAGAKNYVKQEVKKYLESLPFSSAPDYDAWHKNICLTLSDRTKHFVSYSAHRKISKDNFKNKNGFTVGNAQKFLNMLMKDLYACLSMDSTFLKNYEEYFTYCHMPLDSYILRFIDDIRDREAITKIHRDYTWGTLNDYDTYMEEQATIRNYVAKYNPTVTVLQTEFVVWPLYK